MGLVRKCYTLVYNRILQYSYAADMVVSPLPELHVDEITCVIPFVRFSNKNQVYNISRLGIENKI